MTDGISLDNDIQWYLAGKQYDDAMSAARWASRRKAVGTLVNGAGRLVAEGVSLVAKATGAAINLAAGGFVGISNARYQRQREQQAYADCLAKTGLPLDVYDRTVGLIKKAYAEGDFGTVHTLTEYLVRSAPERAPSARPTPPPLPPTHRAAGSPDVGSIAIESLAEEYNPDEDTRLDYR